jgi:hypothetical protein
MRVPGITEEIWTGDARSGGLADPIKGKISTGELLGYRESQIKRRPPNALTLAQTGDMDMFTFEEEAWARPGNFDPFTNSFSKAKAINKFVAKSNAGGKPRLMSASATRVVHASGVNGSIQLKGVNQGIAFIYYKVQGARGIQCKIPIMVQVQPPAIMWADILQGEMRSRKPYKDFTDAFFPSGKYRNSLKEELWNRYVGKQQCSI